MALGVLEKAPGRWFCIGCWAAALGVTDEEGAYAELRDFIRSLTAGPMTLVYNTLYNETGSPMCDMQGPTCEKRLTGTASYSGWRWSIRRVKASP
jgi:hypothetical protein